jgi:hypothetical protein
MFAVIGLATLLAYGLLWLEPLWLGRFQPFDSNASGIAMILGLDWGGVGFYTAAFALPIGLYVAALLLLPQAGSRPAWITAIGVALLAPLLLLYTYPALAADVFDYLISGRILSEHRANPYLETALSYPADPYYPSVGWKDLPSIYGPVWVLIMGAILKVCGDATLAALMATKAIAVAGHWAVAALVYLTVRKLDPARALFAFVAYAWNPLAIVHLAVDGHNDSMMLLCMMAALYFGLERRWELSLPLLTLSALVKFVPAMLLPLFIWQARHDRRRLLTGVAISLAMAALAFAPLWAGLDTFEGVRDQASRMTSSPAALASFIMPDAWLRPVAIALFATGYAVVLQRRLDLPLATYVLVLLYLLIVSFWTKPWYFIWPVALGAVVGGMAFWVTVPGIVGAFASNLFGGWGWMMNWLDWQTRWGMRAMELWLTLSTLGGWLVALLAALLVYSRREMSRAAKTIPGAAERVAG